MTIPDDENEADEVPEVPEITPEMEEAVERLTEEAKAREVDPRVGDYIRNHAKRAWTAKEGCECFIVLNELEGYARMREILGGEPSIPQFWWCGYVRMNRKLFTVPGYSGLLTYVPCPGGITMKAEDSEGCIIYGYDTNHAWDHEKPVGYWTEERMIQETTLFARALILAAIYEDAYLQADGDNDARLEIINNYHKALEIDGIEFKVTENFGAMINALFGQL